jgi:hypothetical protein
VSLRNVTSKLILWSPGTRYSRAVVLLISLAALAFFSACGNYNSNTVNVTCPGATGNFSNSSLPAGSQWTYELSGWFISSTTQSYAPYVEAGVFTVDGKGNITSGFDDAFGSNITGTYSISSNGTGSMNLNLTSISQTLTWAITVSNGNPGSIYLIDADTAFNSSGTAYQQTTSAFSAAPNGNFAFRTHVLAPGASLAGSTASVGVMAVSAGAITGLNEDVLIGGLAPAQRTLGSGAFTAPNSTTGVGTVTFTDSSGLTTSYNYYVIDANTYLLFETDTTNGGLGLGRVEAQSAPGTFTNASLSGGYVFGSHGDTNASAAGGVNSVGQFTTDGAGSVSSGSLDTVIDGNPSLGAAITSTGTASTYSVASNGRTLVTLNANGTVVQATLYLVSGSRGFFLVSNDTTRVEDGTLDQQSAASFSGADFNGQSAFVMGGFEVANATFLPLDRTGTLTSDGKGNLGWAELANSAGSTNAPGCLPGTYTVATNGRVAASVNTLSANLVIYMVSSSKSYMLQGDSATQIFGGSALQASPVVDPPGGF